MGLDFPVVVGNNPLLIGGHPYGRAFSHFVCPIQVSFKLLTFVPLTLHGGLGCGHAYLCGDDCVYFVCESEGSVSHWSSWCCPVGPQDARQLFHPFKFGFLQPFLQRGQQGFFCCFCLPIALRVSWCGV